MQKDVPPKEEVWTRVVVTYVQSSNSVSKVNAIAWADYIAEEYEKRFKK